MSLIIKKYFFSILLLITIISSQNYIYWFGLKAFQEHAHIQMQKKIESKFIKEKYTIKLLTSEIEKNLRWKNEHEFYKDGYICDIISIKSIDEYTFLCYVHDKKETQIEDILQTLHKSNTDSNKHHNTNKINFQPFYFACLVANSLFFPNIRVLPTKHILFSFEKVYNQPPYPPPNFS